MVQSSSKPCQEGSIRNPVTKRCRKIKSRSIKRKSKVIKRKSKSIKRKSRSIKRKSKSIKRKSKSPKRKSKSIKRKSKSIKRKSKSRSIKRKSKSRSIKRKSKSPNRRRGKTPHLVSELIRKFKKIRFGAKSKVKENNKIIKEIKDIIDDKNFDWTFNNVDALDSILGSGGYGKIYYNTLKYLIDNKKFNRHLYNDHTIELAVMNKNSGSPELYNLLNVTKTEEKKIRDYFEMDKW